MFRTIFFKTLYEKRLMITLWTLSSIGLVLFVVIFFPALKDSFAESLKDIPESMRALVGDASDYQTLAGYVNIQVFQQMIFLPVILGVILCTGLIGGEENEGRLQTLLTFPVSRTRIYFEKLAASAVIVAIVTFGFFVGTWLGAILINEKIDMWPVLQATYMTWLVSMGISLIGFALTAAIGRRALAGSVAGAYAFVMYVITTLVTSVEALKTIEYFSPFHYFNSPSPLKEVFDFGDMWVVILACALFALLGYVAFARRDVYQR